MSFLTLGDTIALIAPSCGQKKQDLSASLAYFKQLGLNVVLAENLNHEYRYMAGSDKERAEILNQMYKNPDIKALFCIRGGAGSTRMLPFIDFETIKQNPKPIIGLSDSTAIQNAVFTQTGTPSLTGFLPLYDLKEKEINPLVNESLKKALFSEHHLATSGSCLNAGECCGELVGGCLSVFLYLAGTLYMPDLSNKILLLEDVGEKTYKIDLMLNQLKQQQGFNRLKGIVIGKFTDSQISDEADGDISACIRDFTAGLQIPIITDFAYGHIPARHILPLGLPVTLTASATTCSLSW